MKSDFPADSGKWADVIIKLASCVYLEREVGLYGRESWVELELFGLFTSQRWLSENYVMTNCLAHFLLSLQLINCVRLPTLLFGHGIDCMWLIMIILICHGGDSTDSRRSKESYPIIALLAQTEWNHYEFRVDMQINSIRVYKGFHIIVIQVTNLLCWAINKIRVIAVTNCIEIINFISRVVGSSLCYSECHTSLSFTCALISIWKSWKLSNTLGDYL